MTEDIIKTGVLITHVDTHEGMTKMRGIQLGRRTYAGKSWHQWHGAAREKHPAELARMGTHITRSAYQSLSPSARAAFEKRGVKVVEKERLVHYDVPYQEETRMAYGILDPRVSVAEYQQDPMRYSPYAKKKRRDAVRERAGEISSIPGAPDRPGEARAKMIAAGVMTPEGEYKEITGYYVDPATGKKRFVAKGEPTPTFVREPEVKPEIPPEMRDEVIQEPFRAAELDPEYLMHKDEYTSGTRYEPTAFEPPKPIEVREPGYFERKLREYDIAVSKVIPSLKYYEELGSPYREKYKWKQPEITKVPVAFAKAAYTEIEEKPVTTAAKTAAFIALTKGIGYGTGLVRGIPAIGKPIAEKAIPVGLAGIGIGYGIGVHKRITAPEITIMQKEIAGSPLITEERIERERTKTEKAAIAGEIFAGEILPMGVGGMIGVKPLPKVKLPKIKKAVKTEPYPDVVKMLAEVDKPIIKSPTEIDIRFQKTQIAKAEKVKIEALEMIEFRKMKQREFVRETERIKYDPKIEKVKIERLEKIEFRKMKQREFVRETERIKYDPKYQKIQAEKIKRVKIEASETIAFRRASYKEFAETCRLRIPSERLSEPVLMRVPPIKEPPIRKPVTYAEPSRIILPPETIKAYRMDFPTIAPKPIRVPKKIKYPFITTDLFGISKETPKELRKRYKLPKPIEIPKEIPKKVSKKEKERLKIFKFDPFFMPSRVTKTISEQDIKILPEPKRLPKEVTYPAVITEIVSKKLKKPPERVPKILKPPKKPRKRVIRKKKRLTKAQRHQIRNPSAAVDDFMARTVSTEIFTGQSKKSKKKSKKRGKKK